MQRSVNEARAQLTEREVEFKEEATDEPPSTDDGKVIILIFIQTDITNNGHYYMCTIAMTNS